MLGDFFRERLLGRLKTIGLTSASHRGVANDQSRIHGFYEPSIDLMLPSRALPLSANCKHSLPLDDGRLEPLLHGDEPVQKRLF
ncbi:hypothetical protein DFR28_1016 [Arenicella xantha]|uniref:Uncharacterized protein n=1 Tax=Arenicella xantha TaxID=644221 RepID=A0A395JQC0_9GAMM|nr:hypothetical protein DFR28_1016 [Arenicella xantha]